MKPLPGKGPTPPAVVWPSLGCPASVASGACFPVVARHHQGGPVKARLTPVDDGGHSYPLELVGQTRGCLGDGGAPQGLWSAAVRREGAEVWRLEFRTPPFRDVGPRRGWLCDLEVDLGGETLCKPASVVVRSSPRSNWQALVASDLHWAARWDEVEQELRGWAPAGAFRNPNRQFAAFVGLANRLWDEGALDAVLLTGDLVDHAFQKTPHPGEAPGGDTNWRGFLDLVSGRSGRCPRLRAPLYTTLGNHDRRLYPYRLALTGLAGLGVPPDVAAKYFQKENRPRFGYAPSDLKAVRSREGRRHTLDGYHHEVNPFEGYEVDLGAARLLALDTGPDFFCRPLLALRSPKAFVRGLSSALRNRALAPCSAGLTRNQLEFLKARLARCSPSQPVLVAAHAPPCAAGAGSRLATQLFQGTREFLEALRTAPAPVAVLSGHTHCSGEFGLDRATGRLTRCDEGRAEPARDTLLLLQTPPLSGIGHDAPVAPACRRLTVSAGCRFSWATLPLAGETAELSPR